MYSSNPYGFEPYSVSYVLPLDPELQGRSLHPLGTLQFNRAYGELGFDKARRTLALPASEEHDALKLTALSHLLESLSRPVDAQRALDTGLFSELVLSAAAENESVRTLATGALAAITASRAGREFAVQADVVARLSRLAATEEPEPRVRLHVLQTFLHLSASAAGIRHLLARGLVPLLVTKVAVEDDLSCRAATLEILSVLLRDPDGWRACTEAGLVATAAAVLKEMSNDPDTLAASDSVTLAGGVIATSLKPLFATLSLLAKVIAHVSAVALTGKDACVEHEMVPLLVALLPHPVVAVRAQSSHALQNLTNCESGKRASLACQALTTILDAATLDTDEMVQCQSLQAIANLAEHPAAKNDPDVQARVERMREIARDSDSAKVRHAATLAVDQITWLP